MSKFLDKLKYGKQYGYEVLFKNQPTKPVGKIGVLIAESGLPEDYDLEFYANFMEHVFKYSLPPFLLPIILADRGIALIDPDNPLARTPFTPKTLVDSNGKTTNQAGVPYVDLPFTWVPVARPKNPFDHGYFLYTGEGKNGIPDVCDKVGAKIAAWYYGRLLPEKKVAWRAQLKAVNDDAVQQLQARYPDVAFRYAYYMYPEDFKRAVSELLAEGCETIIYQSITCPLYSDFEDYGHALPMLHELAAGKARVIMADQLGNQPAMREAFLAILRDQLREIPPESSLLVVLTVHGHPFTKETQDLRAPLYREPLEAGVRELLAGRNGKWQVVWAHDEEEDPKETMPETREALEAGIHAGFDYILELPTEFPAENTDLMIFHAMKKYPIFEDYNRDDPIPYPDWEKPLIRSFHSGKTNYIYAGCPVGPYRKHVVEAVVASISQVLSAA